MRSAECGVRSAECGVRSAECSKCGLCIVEKHSVYFLHSALHVFHVTDNLAKN